MFLFDLDDTLVCSGYASWIPCTALVNDFLQSKGVNETYSADDLGRTCLGIPIDSFLKTLAQRKGFSVSEKELANIVADTEPLIVDYFRNNLKPIPAVREALLQLQASKHDVGIVTSSSRSWIDACLAASNLAEFFDDRMIFSARSLKLNVKPDPAVYKQALANLPGGTHTVAVEDSVSGVRSAVAAGVPTIIGCLAFILPDMRQQHASKLGESGANAMFETWNDFLSAVDEALNVTPPIQSVSLPAT